MKKVARIGMEKRRIIVIGKSRCLQLRVSKCSSAQAGTLKYFISQMKPAYLLLTHPLRDFFKLILACSESPLKMRSLLRRQICSSVKESNPASYINQLLFTSRNKQTFE